MTELKTCSVLLVEDDPSDANLVRQNLGLVEGMEFQVTWVDTLKEALRLLRSAAQDVMLLDLNLPDSSGMGTLQQVCVAAPALPVIVLSGRNDAEFAAEAIAHGAQDYLIKGQFDTDVLVRSIRHSMERSALYAKLKASHDLLHKLTCQVPGLLFQFRLYPDGRMTFPFASEGLYELYGVTPEQAAADASTIFSFQHPDDAPGIRASIEKSARELTPWQHEYRIILPGKGVRWRQGMARPERLEDGSVLWHGFISDITERKEIEAHQRLAARVFETTGEAILVTDLAANIIAVNPAFTRITGYSEQEVLGKNPRILKSGRYGQRFYQQFWQALTTRGEWVGEIWNRRKNGEEFPQWETVSVIRDDSGKPVRYVAVFSDMTQIYQAQQKLNALAWRDSLTNLANRALFIRQVEQVLLVAQRENRYASVLLLDLDRFKAINEARGLGVGDALLTEVARRLAQVLHEDDLLARLDSDEFAILLPGLLHDREQAAREALAKAERLRQVLLEMIEIGGERIHVDASVGIAIMPESSGETAVEVLRQADMAIARAKAEGGGRVVFFEAAMGASARERFQLESELRFAVKHNQLRLYLQPQVDAQGRQVGAEALVRWQHPARGLLSPGQFVPLAESSDLIVLLDRWMLGEVCKLLALLDAQGRALRISVNISPRHFNRPDFVEEFKHVLVQTGADATHLVLEITEGMMLGNINEVIARMTALATLGVHFSIDDFGTGYSSLSYIKRLPIHELKIDKSFIQDVSVDPNDAALVETILSVAEHLHLRVVAEGVETEEQVAFLRQRGRVMYQGYLFGRPEPMEVWLKRYLAEGEQS